MMRGASKEGVEGTILFRLKKKGDKPYVTNFNNY